MSKQISFDLIIALVKKQKTYYAMRKNSLFETKQKKYYDG